MVFNQREYDRIKNARFLPGGAGTNLATGFCHEMIAIMGYMDEGYKVYRAVVDYHEVDFLLEKDGGYIRVDATKAQFTSIKRNKIYLKPHKRENLQKNRVDIVANVVLSSEGSDKFLFNVIETRKEDVMPAPVLYLPLLTQKAAS